MKILEAFDLTRSLRDARELAGGRVRVRHRADAYM
jgi:hypothetical protein